MEKPPPPPPTSITVSHKLTTLTSLLERSRCLESEVEASLLFASSLLEHPEGIRDSTAGTVHEHETDAAAAAADDDDNDNSAALRDKSIDELPGGVKDAWLALSDAAAVAAVSGDGAAGDDDALIVSSSFTGRSSNSNMNGGAAALSTLHAPLGKGQLSKAVSTTGLACALKRASVAASDLVTLSVSNRKRKQFVEGYNDSGGDGTPSLLENVTSLERVLGDVASSGGNTLDVYLEAFYRRLLEVREYHAKHDRNDQPNNNQSKKRKYGNPEADGYDLAGTISFDVSKIRDGNAFSLDEVLGKYLDLANVHERHAVSSSKPLRLLFVKAESQMNEKQQRINKKNGEAKNAISYVEFLILLGEPLTKIVPEKLKLDCRKKYIRFLSDLKLYLEGFIVRTQPLLNVKEELIASAVSDFEKEWIKKGCVPGWSPESSKMGENCNESSAFRESIDLSKYDDVAALEGLGGDKLKVELMKLGMKCGGTVKDRAKRLFQVKSAPLHELPKKLFVGNKVPLPKESHIERSVAGVMGESRKDIARLEIIATTLLNHLRPVLDATRRRADRRLTQTTQEKETEVEEEINGTLLQLQEVENKNGADGDEDSDDEAPIYNPKGVPLDFDGKPIPYWLFKLHGLNHYFPCEICGNENYRGRMNFEKHFTEAKHTYGMRCLGIPNTKHFHGVTQIEDARKLWNSLQGQLSEEKFDRSKEEEFEDSHGNVLSLATYEDLARQGLL
mmetsp:Transcript_8509/g.10919  ORF Transcript_8509/g.10919 Transcript_8509/m.10919 type:complete len:731 (-) Transcript_8509:82-2274(-)